MTKPLQMWQTVLCLCIWLLSRGLGFVTFPLVLSMIWVHLICPVVIVLAGCAGLTPGPGICLAVGIHLFGTVVLTCFVLQTHLRRQNREWHSCKRDIWNSYAPYRSVCKLAGTDPTDPARSIADANRKTAFAPNKS